MQLKGNKWFADDWIQPQTSGVASDCSTNWATPLPLHVYFYFNNCLSIGYCIIKEIHINNLFPNFEPVHHRDKNILFMDLKQAIHQAIQLHLLLKPAVLLK